MTNITENEIIALKLILLRRTPTAKLNDEVTEAEVTMNYKDNDIILCPVCGALPCDQANEIDATKSIVDKVFVNKEEFRELQNENTTVDLMSRKMPWE